MRWDSSVDQEHGSHQSMFWQSHPDPYYSYSNSFARSIIPHQNYSINRLLWWKLLLIGTHMKRTTNIHNPLIVQLDWLFRHKEHINIASYFSNNSITCILISIWWSILFLCNLSQFMRTWPGSLQFQHTTDLLLDLDIDLGLSLLFPFCLDLSLTYKPCAWLSVCPVISWSIFSLVSKEFLTSFREIVSSRTT